jgi:hypothetical protein
LRLRRERCCSTAARALGNRARKDGQVTLHVFLDGLAAHRDGQAGLNPLQSCHDRGLHKNVHKPPIPVGVHVGRASGVGVDRGAVDEAQGVGLGINEEIRMKKSRFTDPQIMSVVSGRRSVGQLPALQ